MARIWGEEAHHYAGKPFPDCGRCGLPGRERERERWGCDTPSGSGVFQIGCGSCHGKDLSCTRCGGTGVLDQHRCPTKVLGDASPPIQLQVDLLVRCYLQYEARHVLPVDGGLINQTRSFVSGCEIIDAERGRYEAMKEAKRERDRLASQTKHVKGTHGL